VKAIFIRADGEEEATLEKRICKPTDRSNLSAWFSSLSKTLKPGAPFFDSRF
jgi:hypothetical protein